MYRILEDILNDGKVERRVPIVGHEEKRELIPSISHGCAIEHVMGGQEDTIRDTPGRPDKG